LPQALKANPQPHKKPYREEVLVSGRAVSSKKRIEKEQPMHPFFSTSVQPWQTDIEKDQVGLQCFGSLDGL